MAGDVSGGTSLPLASIVLKPWPDTLEYAVGYPTASGSEKSTSQVRREMGSMPRLWKCDKRSLELKPAKWQSNVQTIWEDKTLPP